jgi:hypothetical protein
MMSKFINVLLLVLFSYWLGVDLTETEELWIVGLDIFFIVVNAAYILGDSK